MPGKKISSRQLSAPATKQDIVLIMDSIGNLYDATERWKNEMLDQMFNWKEEMLDHMSKWKTETHHYFDVKTEQLTHDFQDALKDKISVHDDRLERHDREICALRVHTGMRA